MDNVNYSPRILPLITAHGLLSEEPFTLLDVGSAMGIDPIWRHFGDDLVAYGFEPQIAECNLLNSREKNKRVRYFPSFVGLPESHPFKVLERYYKPKRADYFDPFGRSSSIAAISRKKPGSEAQTSLDATEKWQEQALSTDTIALSAFIRDQGIKHVDFIKIDTDGADFEALQSVAPSIRTCGVLGFMIETPFYGHPDETSNSLHNIDRFMKEQGFMLYNISVNRYSRAALPSKFSMNFPWQTVTGQAMWGDLIYLRDGAANDYTKVWDEPLSPVKLLKLACLYDIFQLADCAAELIVNNMDAVSTLIDPEHLLDTLTPPLNGKWLSYREYIAEFERSFESFFPDAETSNSWGNIR